MPATEANYDSWLEDVKIFAKIDDIKNKNKIIKLKTVKAVAKFILFAFKHVQKIPYHSHIFKNQIRAQIIELNVFLRNRI